VVVHGLAHHRAALGGAGGRAAHRTTPCHQPQPTQTAAQLTWVDIGLVLRLVPLGLALAQVRVRAVGLQCWEVVGVVVGVVCGWVQVGLGRS
jgi:hypothetical protein